MSSSQQTPISIFTIGHSNLSAEDFLALLRQHGITILVDVRSAPYSRYVPHFNKNQLEIFLKDNGLDYRFAGEYLGGQPKDETVYKNQVVPDEGASREKFLKVVQYELVMKQEWYQRGIQRLLELAREGEQRKSGVVIMCSEGNPLDCHRHHLIARSLLDPVIRVTETDVKVQHILKDGNIEIVDPSVFEVNNSIPFQPRLFD